MRLCVWEYSCISISLGCTVVTALIQIREEIDGDLILRRFILWQTEIKISSVSSLDVRGKWLDFDNA